MVVGDHAEVEYPWYNSSGIRLVTEGLSSGAGQSSGCGILRHDELHIS